MKLFINAHNLDNINWDDEKIGWRNSPRLNKLPINEICLYQFDPTHVTNGHALTLLKIQGLAKLFTTDYQMPQGLFPLLLTDDNTFYFTDIEQYSYLDNHWAFNNIYKTKIDNNISFAEYKPTVIEQTKKCTIQPMHIRAGKLFEMADKALDGQILAFCSNNQHALLEVTYSDRYVKKELGLITCILFINNIIELMQPSAYKVNFIGEKFEESDANFEKYRKLDDSFANDEYRDDAGQQLAGEHYTFISKDKKDIHHYRELEVKVTYEDNRTCTLRLIPDAGLGQWRFDIVQAKKDYIFYNTGNLNPQIPIFSQEDQIYILEID